jgi:uncharacterized protein YndB with AHSA1/START domain
MANSLNSFGPEDDVTRLEIDLRARESFGFSEPLSGVEAVHCGVYLKLDWPCLMVFTWIYGEANDEQTNPKRLSRVPISETT